MEEDKFQRPLQRLFNFSTFSFNTRYPRLNSAASDYETATSTSRFSHRQQYARLKQANDISGSGTLIGLIKCSLKGLLTIVQKMSTMIDCRPIYFSAAGISHGKFAMSCQ